MNNPIIAELARLYPDYKLSAQKVREACKAQNPVEVARYLESNIAQLREKMRDQLGLIDVPIDRIVPLLSFNNKITGYGAMADSQLLKGYDKGEVFALGRSALDPVRAMYQAILGREPDDDGYTFWNGCYRDGFPLSKICEHMEREKAAGG